MSSSRIPAPDRGTHTLVLEPGSSVGDYQVTYLGAGGMSIVYKAEKNGRTYVLKEVPSSEPQHVLALTQEKGLLERLDHPGIVSFEGLFEENGFYYLALEYIDGEPLDKVMAGGPSREQTVLDWGVQLCDIFEYLHSQKPPIIYRDLKPENLLLEGDRLRLIDFGIARLHKEDRKSDTHLMGSVTTASPEHYGGSQTDERSDIYTLGATLYDLLTGGKRKRGGAFQFAPLREVNPAVSEKTEAIIMQALQFKPENRQQSMAELRDQLRPQTGPTESPPPTAAAPAPPEPEAARRKTPRLLLVLPLLLLALVAAFFLAQPSAPPLDKDTGFSGNIFSQRDDEGRSVVTLGEEIGLLTLTDGFGLSASQRASYVTDRLNALYHQACPLCHQMKLEPDGFRTGKVVVTDSKGNKMGYTAVFYAHLHGDTGIYYEKPVLLTTINEEQAKEMGATRTHAAAYWRDVIRDLVQLSRGRQTDGPLWDKFGPAFLEARTGMSDDASAENLHRLLRELDNQTTFQLKDILRTVPPDFTTDVDSFPPVKAPVQPESEQQVEYEPLSG
ncbi:MAG: serine/threonine protein kinase [Candidatus Eremiobacteraeota bacterium]|nr:serine/threonine protein kinase [Candidatus Eremiobacteraeota bacterium]